MTFDPLQTYCWFPTENGGETLHQREEAAALSWLQEHLSPSTQREWLPRIRSRRDRIEPTDAIKSICKHDSAELVELLYPRSPILFEKARQYTLSSTLFTNLYEGPFSEEILRQCTCARTGHLSAACLFALCGATGCLEKLLEYGADPDGLETPNSWSYIDLPHGQTLPVSPMDCALLSDSEDCRLLLEMFGGKPLSEHI